MENHTRPFFFPAKEALIIFSIFIFILTYMLVLIILFFGFVLLVLLVFKSLIPAVCS